MPKRFATKSEHREPAALEDDSGRIDIAQSLCSDPVLAASVFKPNAHGCWELASLAAMSDRQLLKGAGCYFAERVLVAVTTTEVAAIDVGISGVLRRHTQCWRRDELLALAVDNLDGRVPLPAVSLQARYGSPRVELAPRDAGPSTLSVLKRLMR
jgi:hypothetical protein